MVATLLSMASVVQDTHAIALEWKGDGSTGQWGDPDNWEVEGKDADKEENSIPDESDEEAKFKANVPQGSIITLGNTSYSIKKLKVEHEQSFTLTADSGTTLTLADKIEVKKGSSLTLDLTILGEVEFKVEDEGSELIIAHPDALGEGVGKDGKIEIKKGATLTSALDELIIENELKTDDDATIAGSGDIIIEGKLDSKKGELTIATDGSVTLKNQDNKIDSDIYVETGSLMIAAGSDTDKADIFVMDGATIGGSGEIKGDLTIYSGGILDLSDSLILPEKAKDIELEDGAVLAFEIRDSTPTDAFAGLNSLDLSQTILSITLADDYSLPTLGGISIENYFGFDEDNTPDYLFEGERGQIINGDTLVSLKNTEGPQVPEPSSYSLLIGLVAISTALNRRKR